MTTNLEVAIAPSPREQPGHDLLGGQITSLPILLLNVHEHCNCRCLMCDIWKRKDGRELDLEDFARHRESILRLNVQQVVLTGGEPLMHRNFPGLCRFLREVARITLLTTYLAGAKTCGRSRAGVDEIIVSIDGPEEMHDRVRGIKEPSGSSTVVSGP